MAVVVIHAGAGGDIIVELVVGTRAFVFVWLAVAPPLLTLC